MAFQLFRSFTNQNEVDDILSDLDRRNIKYKIAKTENHLGSSFGETPQRVIELYILSKDINVVQQVLYERALNLIDGVDPDHYLYSFSLNELQDLLSNPTEWSELDVLLAQRIMNESESQTELTESYSFTPPENEERVKSFKIKNSFADKAQYAAFFLLTSFIGASVIIYVKAYIPEATDTHIAIGIAVLITINLMYYFSLYTCPKCKESFNTEKVHRLEEGDIAMPPPYNVLERFKCHNCGHVWDEFSEERHGD